MLKRLLLCIAMVNAQWSMVNAQITIGGNVYGGGNNGEVKQNGSVTVNEGTFTGNIYGGGNQGNLNGTASVTLRGGDFQGSVFGGSRIANVGKYAYVNIDGNGQLHDITANYIYGGNDIAGHVGDYLTSSDAMPFTPEVNSGLTLLVDNSWQSYILATPERILNTNQLHTYIGQMYGGGNGDYTYPTQAESGKWIIKDKTNTETVATLDAQPNKPIVAKTYMQVNGGTYGNVYAGGNAATVTGQAVISINNTSDVTHTTEHLAVEDYTKLSELNTESMTNPVDLRLLQMGLNLSTFNNDRHFINIFGGNNKADMAIRPVWNLHRGSVHNLYSGGNEGRMTNPEGILLEIKASSEIVADNVYGGCRKADVRPLYPSGTDVPTRDIQLIDPAYKFPNGFSARVLVRGGTITNVYGGNDISGNVWGGNAVGVYHSISGDIYGGGNGSYSYTDNKDLEEDIIWGDFYYDPSAYMGRADHGDFTPAESAEALTALRPNAEQVSIRVYGGEDETKPIVIGGSIYVGGNSASIKPQESNPIENPQVHLKIGSNVIADNVFLGNNGEQMVDASANGVLARYAGTVVGADTHTYNFSSLNLENSEIFATYMEGCAMKQIPSVVFDSELENGDPATYHDYTTMFGSVFCGGNIGSMILDGVTEVNFRHPIIIFEKLVGGCNNANVPAHDGLNARFEGGFMTPGSNGPTVGATTPIADKIILDLSGIDIQPKRWKGTKDASGKYTSYELDTNGNRQLEWNTIDARTGQEVAPPTSLPSTANADGSNTSDDDLNRRLTGGNVYGGCYNSGHIDGNVVINLDGTILNRWDIFDEVEENENGEAALYANDHYTITKRNSGVILDQQGMDVLGKALNVFGGGYGADSEIWGSTTVNLNRGYTFQIFGGGEHGAIGKGERDAAGVLQYDTYDPRFSCYVNLNGTIAGSKRNKTDRTEKPNMADTEFIYGGGFMGTIIGNTVVHLGNGRIFNSFAGSCNADILGHTETYVGLDAEEEVGYPYVRDHIYGGNDLGGSILGSGNQDFSSRLSSYMAAGRRRTAMHGYSVPDGSTVGSTPGTTAAAYIEYTRGRVDNIFGGCYGNYDYTNTTLYGDFINADGTDKPGFTKPRLDNAFVNFRPDSYSANEVNRIYGAGQGYTDGIDMNILQQRSYVLIDIPQSIEHNFENLDVFGAGENCGLGMKAAPETAAAAPDQYSAVIDLFRGIIHTVYGASYNGGITRRTVVNVPAVSTISLQSIFGGGYGQDTFTPCDAYEANVNWRSENALVANNIYGGNNNERRTVFGKVNIYAPVWSDKSRGYLGTVYGAGLGKDTWSEYSEVNLEDGALVFEVYGGGREGKVFNAESVQKYKDFFGVAGEAWRLEAYNDPSANYAENAYTNLTNTLARTAEMDMRTFATDADRTKFYKKYNANVIIKQGAQVGRVVKTTDPDTSKESTSFVGGYVYGGGYGADAFVAGTTYVALLGGTVVKDIYGSGTSGSVEDYIGAKTFKASTNVYIKGGTVRNVFGGGWRGDVGHHVGLISDINNVSEGSITSADYSQYPNDIDGEANVVIGDADGTDFYNGIPAIKRNVYGGGEGGCIYGNANVIINNGRIGYNYTVPGGSAAGEYAEELDEPDKYSDTDPTAGRGTLDKGGNVFGGGYVANSYVDRSHVTMYDGIVRGSLYGGGEIGPIGRGTVHPDKPAGPITNHAAKIYKGGETHVYLYGGHVTRDIFGGGRGYDNWNGEGTMSDAEKLTMDRSSKGYVFGSTDVHIRGGEVGTAQNALHGYGNIFGGGNEGFVYSATGTKVGRDRSDEHLSQGVPRDGGGYYYKGGDIANGLSLDCNVDVEPYSKVKPGGVTIGGTSYAEGDFVPVEELNKLKNRNHDGSTWDKLDIEGITIHNALFAGGNITEGSDMLFANTVTVFGNVGVSLRDVYNYDLISLGTDEIGGLYGDGNLTLVDGFREVHIDNYGTDYYSLDKSLNYDHYLLLTTRQKAYYQLRYGANSAHSYSFYESKTLHTYTITDGDTGETTVIAYRKGQKITSTDWERLTETEQANWAPGSKAYEKDEQIDEAEWALMDPAEQEGWTLLGVCPIYAGRPMNTIQRADMCGVFGSRLVLRGAQDRVPEKVDYSEYTINRVDEVSLNKRDTQAGDDSEEDKVHGNYFGIYNTVNYLGNLTSDVFFLSDDSAPDAIRQTDVKDDKEGSPTYANGTTTYYDWKKDRPQGKYRNNGISRNKVALASGVYLEIQREESEKMAQPEWGYITGVVELDLINVMQGMGGGYVYARNEHGAKSWHREWGKVTLLNYNTEARTYRRFQYDNTSGNKLDIETSGNFVHNTKQIVDDCYPNGGMYNPEKEAYEDSPAHYWFIKGSIYVYDQYISAYTGAANAYLERVTMPLTISAAANGRMTLREVQPNYYAYYDKNGQVLGSDGAEETIVTNEGTYRLNDPVSYWNYRIMSEADQTKFVEETYVTIAECKIGDTTYPKGMVMLPGKLDGTEPGTYYWYKKTAETAGVTYEENGVVKSDKDFDYFFRPSNNLSHNKGYILTYEVNNPKVWNKYYTLTNGPEQANRITSEAYDKLERSVAETYSSGPTFSLKNAEDEGIYGQEEKKHGDIISKYAKNSYDSNVTPHKNKLSAEDLAAQAVMAPAYVVTSELAVTDTEGNEVARYYPGARIGHTEGQDDGFTDAQWTAILASGKVEAAKVCTAFLEFSTTDYVYASEVLSSADIATLKTKIIAQQEFVDDASGTADAKATAFLNSYIDDSYFCTKDGLYGGNYFTTGVAYRALDTFCAMPEDERAKFSFNYDALDLLVDPTYGGRLETNYGNKAQYDGTNDPKIYTIQQPIDYQAEYKGEEGNLTEEGTGKQYKEYTLRDGTKKRIYKATSTADWLSREDYEAIPNEKHHYAPITVTKPGTYYVVNNAFMRGDIPYTVGQSIDEKSYLSMTDQQKANVDVLNFNAAHVTQKKDSEGHLLYLNSDGEETTTATDEPIYEDTYYYYCRQAYTINEKGEGQSVTTMGIKAETTPHTYDINEEVPQGVIIDKAHYDALKNYQSGFAIHGTLPTETSTLYVSNESDIFDLSTEKIITVIYLYEYEESDESGLNVTPVSERHIVNIHIGFKSGAPEIGPLNTPDIVLPGTAVGLDVPSVTQGAYRVTEAGWEIFDDYNDAETHTNGMPYQNNVTPVYWYQNNYWIAYYAQTYLGKTYSMPVKISVANYHDLARIMADTEHHFYIDHKDVERKPKIYINDYSSASSGSTAGTNGLTLLRDLIDLTHGKTETSNPDLAGHAALDLSHTDKPLRGGQYLEFFLRADQTAPAATGGSDAWTPIANDEGECFSGTLHGDGYTVSGLDNSLFGHLCGNVYNLGVTGTFTGAGIAETGDGYVENCWMSTTSTAAKTSHPVFGNPIIEENTERPYRIVNCYYLENDDAPEAERYTNHSGTYGTPTRKTAQAFYNGEVAYDLNGFYLNKRFYDSSSASVPGGSATGEYNYFAATPTATLTKLTARYPSSPDAQYGDIGYVENRFKDGDFIYAAGSIPSSPNVRTSVEGDDTRYYPIWPDDYLFFGQMLTYGYAFNRPHQPLPAHINKDDGRLTTTATSINRVYRAPAYFQSSAMGAAHYNPYAIFAANSEDESHTAYPLMTAIDFTGYNDDTWQRATASSGPAAGKAFYPPLLDNDGLTFFRNVDLTKNLLVYTPSATEDDPTTADSRTNSAVNTALNEPVYLETNAAYRTVAIQDDGHVYGHPVELSETDGYQGLKDHFLVDRQDFNAPIAYTFDDSHRMFYQRTPERFVDRTKGWEAISLPFTAELVTTQTKGEITHFYSAPSGSDAEEESTVGHEYWLRKFTTGGKRADDNNQVYLANLVYPTEGTNDKEYSNTFLWDYYYSKSTQRDKNQDKYQVYYRDAHTHTKYAYSEAATPYIIGFPGVTYYEFDLSGTFKPLNTFAEIARLDPQVITFSQEPGQSIQISDTELTAGRATDLSYDFVPVYMAQDIPAGTFVLNSQGSSFDKTEAVSKSVPFRPYFATTATAPARPATRSIMFTNEANESLMPHKSQDSDEPGMLRARPARHKIVVESTLRTAADVSILNAAGITVATFTIQPGETIETRIASAGVYIVQATDGRFIKKLAIN